MTPSEYKRKRIKLGFTQAQLAAQLCIPREAVVRRERGQQRITREAELALSLINPKERPQAG